MARSFAQAREQSSYRAPAKRTAGSMYGKGTASYRAPAPKRTAGSMYGAGTASYRAPARRTYNPPAPARRTYNPPAAPVYRAPAYSPPAYTPPTYYAPPPAQNYYSPPPAQTFSAPTQRAFAAPEPAPAPPPPPPPPKRPEKLNATDWLEGDSGYQDQMSEYDRAAQTFLERITKEKKQFNLDNDLAVTGNKRNRGVALDDNANDFASRGLIHSGLFDQESTQLNERFNEQDSLLARILQRQLGDADDRLADNRSEVSLGRGNAKRSALARMAAKQAIMDQDFDSKMDAYNAKWGL